MSHIVLPVACCLLPVAGVLAADWPTFQGEASRKGVSGEPFKAPDRIGWRFDIREGLPPAYKPVEFSVPVISGGALFVGTSLKRFFCLSIKDSSFIWSFDTKAEVESTATVWEDTVYFGDNAGIFYALNSGNGGILWKYETGGEILSSPLIVNGIIYFTNTSGEVYALDARTGKKLWQYRRATQRGFSIRGSSSPSHDGANIYVGFSDGFVVALNPFDGAAVWERRLADPRRQFKDVDASPVPDDGSIYVPFYDGSLYSLKASDGSVNWKFDDGGAGNPAITKDSIYLPSSKGAIYSLDKAAGRQNWVYRVEEGVPSSVIAAGGHLIFGLSTDGVTALDAEKGEEKFRFAPGSGVYGGLCYSDGNIYYLSNGGFIYSMPCK